MKSAIDALHEAVWRVQYRFLSEASETIIERYDDPEDAISMPLAGLLITGVLAFALEAASSVLGIVVVLIVFVPSVWLAAVYLAASVIYYRERTEVEEVLA